MFSRFLRYLVTLFVALLMLSLVSYAVLLRDPLNHPLAQPSLFSGYVQYINTLLHGDLGISYNGQEPLTQQILSVFPATLELCVFAMAIALLFGLPIGLLSAWYHNKRLGLWIRGLTTLGLSIPIFWLSPLLLYFAAQSHWEISAVGQYNLLYQIPTVTGFTIVDVWFMDAPYRIKIVQNVLQHLVLPSLVLALYPMMEIIRLIEKRAKWVLSQNYVMMAQIRGWSKLKILRLHGLHNTLGATLPNIARQFMLMLALCMLIENIFSWPGIGYWLIEALNQQDYNAIAASIIVIGLFIISVNVGVHFMMFLLDPLGKKGWRNV